MSEKKLHVLSYEHGGYVLWWSEVEKQLTLKLGWLDKYPKFKFGLDYEAFTFDECDRIAPHINKLIAETLEKYPDRFALGSTTYGQPLSLYISEESNARQLIYAVRTNLSHFGTTPKVYAISEFALHNQIPQLAKQVGYEAGILRSHVMGFGYPRTFDSAWGNWIGPGPVPPLPGTASQPIHRKIPPPEPHPGPVVSDFFPPTGSAAYSLQIGWHFLPPLPHTQEQTCALP